MSFEVEVYAVVRRIPPGQVVTYGQVAALVGRERAARAVGGAMRHCPDGVPWHRVVNAQGGISRRRQGSGMLTQRIRLEQEGVRLRRGRVWLARYQWEPPMAGPRKVSRPASGDRSRPAARIAAIVGSSKRLADSKRPPHPVPGVTPKRSSHPASSGSSKRSVGSPKPLLHPARMGGRRGGPERPPRL